ncbi:hypothetical protein PAMP_008945 [Pampus punctatissimus]
MSMRVREDEKQYERDPAECDQQGPRCALRTTLCCLSGRGSHAANDKTPMHGLRYIREPANKRCTGQEASRTDRILPFSACRLEVLPLMAGAISKCLRRLWPRAQRKRRFIDRMCQARGEDEGADIPIVKYKAP